MSIIPNNHQWQEIRVKSHELVELLDNFEHDLERAAADIELPKYFVETVHNWKVHASIIRNQIEDNNIKILTTPDGKT